LPAAGDCNQRDSHRHAAVCTPGERFDLLSREAGLRFLPLFAKQIFHQDVAQHARLLAFSGSGSVAGAIVVAWLGKYKRMGRTALIVQALCGLLIAGFALSRVLWLSDILLFCTGAALIIVFATVRSLVQLVVPNELRGRVMSIYMVAFRRRHAAG